MNSKWTAKWKKCLVWFSAYISYMAFALVGGYTIVKGDDEELKKTTKLAFVVTMIFAALSAFMSIFYNFASMSDTYYNSGAYDFYNYTNKFIAIAEIIVYAVFIVLELVKKEKETDGE